MTFSPAAAAVYLRGAPGSSPRAAPGPTRAASEQTTSATTTTTGLAKDERQMLRIYHGGALMLHWGIDFSKIDIDSANVESKRNSDLNRPSRRRSCHTDVPSSNFGFTTTFLATLVLHRHRIVEFVLATRRLCRRRWCCTDFIDQFDVRATRTSLPIWCIWHQAGTVFDRLGAFGTGLKQPSAWGTGLKRGTWPHALPLRAADTTPI